MHLFFSHKLPREVACCCCCWKPINTETRQIRRQQCISNSCKATPIVVSQQQQRTQTIKKGTVSTANCVFPTRCWCESFLAKPILTQHKEKLSFPLCGGVVMMADPGTRKTSPIPNGSSFFLVVATCILGVMAKQHSKASSSFINRCSSCRPALRSRIVFEFEAEKLFSERRQMIRAVARNKHTIPIRHVTVAYNLS